MSAAVPLTCKKCDGPLNPSDEKCPECKTENPSYVRTALRVVEATTAAPQTDSAFAEVLKELARARACGCKVIANVGLSDAGKSWLIARMGTLRLGTRRATLYSETAPPVTKILQSGEVLDRTHRDQSYVWHLEPAAAGPDTRSGPWRIIDIAGELVSDLKFIENITSGRPLYDLLTMTLAHASAIVLVIDGGEIAREDSERAAGRPPLEKTVDERNAAILNELIRLTRFLHYWRALMPAPANLSELGALKEKIRENPNLDLDTVHPMLTVPTLLMVSKADALVRLAPGSTAACASPGPDPLKFGRQRLPRTWAMALQNINVSRWGLAAPFVGQPRQTEEPELASPPQPDPSKIINFERPSFGVGQALRWLDSELTTRSIDTGLTAQRAQNRLWRWWPYIPRGARP
jgi:hypothetical protein